MYEIIAYSCIIILLPIIPAYILYTAIPVKVPDKDDEVTGKYQGLNIKLKGAFAGYFILALLLTSFIGTRLMTASEYEYWTVEGVIDISKAGDPDLITFTIEPPDQQKYPNGRFVIKNVPIRKGSNKSSTLVLAKMSDGKRTEEVVNLEEDKKAYEKEKRYLITFRKDKVISIDTPISFASDSQKNIGSSSYSIDNAVVPQQIHN